MNGQGILDVVLPPLEERLRPEVVFIPEWLVTVEVPILIVTDDADQGGFNELDGFHLGQAIKALGDDPWLHIRFRVTKAHRQAIAGADLTDFRFDAHNLAQYSQIWLFGIDESGEGDPLSPSELRALAEFMEGGGGIFATGDHQDLGNTLCAEVPRVRSMRRWWFPDPGPNGEPVAPDVTGPKSHDTQVMGGTQIDPFPQTITPVLYSRTIRSTSLTTMVERYPHPLLCSPSGVIRHLPDHMHEGLCEVPGDLGRVWTFDGRDFEEYPSRDGHRQPPEVIAFADNRNSPRDFGVLGAYDGHRVGIGRVVVDATWHHWFNINAWPYINASDPSHASFTPATVPQWKEIKAFWRNVAVWLARPSLQTLISNGAWVRTLGDQSLAMAARNFDRQPNQAAYLWQLGTFARDALGRGASQCQALEWRLHLVQHVPWPFRINPWLPPEFDHFDPLPGLDFQAIETVMLGAAVQAGREKFGDIGKPQALLENEGREVEDVLRAGVMRGLEVFRNHFAETCEAGRNVLGQLG